MDSQGKKKLEDEDIYYDFYSKNVFLHMLGGSLLTRKSPVLHLLNVAYVVGLVALYVFLMLQSAYTLIYVPLDRFTGIRVFHALFLSVCGKVMLLLFYYFEDEMREASEILAQGMFHYRAQDENAHSIKKNRVKQLSVLVPSMSTVTLSCSFSNTFLPPVATYFLGNEDSPDGTLNPFLPLPIYIPFNTRTFLGYATAFCMEGWFLFTLYTLTFAFAESFVSLLLQIVGELEVLNCSLKNIRMRAINLKSVDQLDTSEGEMEITLSMNLCLKENIMHHQSILRFLKVIRPFLECHNLICVGVFCVLLAIPLIVVMENPKTHIPILLMGVVDIFGYLALCLIGEMVIEKSAELHYALYETPWAECDKPFGRSIGIMLSFSQFPIRVRTKGLAMDCSLKNYGDMVSAGYKLVNILRTQM